MMRDDGLALDRGWGRFPVARTAKGGGGVQAARGTHSIATSPRADGGSVFCAVIVAKHV